MAENMLKQFCAEDGAIVLKISYPKTVRDFYKGAVEAFINTAKTRLLDHALDDYRASDDPRKRYRFKPHLYEFCLTQKNEAQSELCIIARGNIIRRERHHWRGEILIKRERI